MDRKLMVSSFRNILLAGIYIFGISQFMYYGESLFKDMGDSNLIPFVMLLLFSLSAAVVGSLVFGQSVMLFFDNKKSESVKSIFYSVGWLFVLTVAVVTTLFIIK